MAGVLTMNIIGYIVDFVWSISLGLYVLLSYKLCGEKENAESN